MKKKTIQKISTSIMAFTLAAGVFVSGSTTVNAAETKSKQLRNEVSELGISNQTLTELTDSTAVVDAVNKVAEKANAGQTVAINVALFKSVPVKVLNTLSEKGLGLLFVEQKKDKANIYIVESDKLAGFEGKYAGPAAIEGLASVVAKDLPVYVATFVVPEGVSVFNANAAAIGNQVTDTENGINENKSALYSEFVTKLAEAQAALAEKEALEKKIADGDPVLQPAYWVTHPDGYGGYTSGWGFNRHGMMTGISYFYGISIVEDPNVVPTGYYNAGRIIFG